MSNILITGGAGFIGSTSALKYASLGYDVSVIDNMSRKGASENAYYLEKTGIEIINGDIRDSELIKKLIESNRYTHVLHLAGQVAVTTSVVNPMDDFTTNALGTFNVLEAVREKSPETSIIYSSTNKVYGKMENATVHVNNGRYEYKDLVEGVSEDYPLSFYSPYGCSKGAGDQYIIDYARIYGLRSVSFRQSCIYGPRQYGIEDQGWIAWFTIASLLGKRITVYGDGMQIRDVLHVDDLVDAYIQAFDNIDSISGEAFNIGGGVNNTLSLKELIHLIETESGNKIDFDEADWRPGDQKVFVCNISKANEKFGWKPKINVQSGLKQLYNWTNKNLNAIDKILTA
ncbi:MAG: UDP-glucose 4-epimerase [Fluviibacter phosphoraccumulans EoVTN8]